MSRPNGDGGYQRLFPQCGPEPDEKGPRRRFLSSGLLLCPTIRLPFIHRCFVIIFSVSYAPPAGPEELPQSEFASSITIAPKEGAAMDYDRTEKNGIKSTDLESSIISAHEKYFGADGESPEIVGEQSLLYNAVLRYFTGKS